MWDIYLSFFLYSALLIFLLYIIKRDFIAQKEKAIRSDQLKTAFLSNMSHEIRTPMNAIVGFSSLIEDEKDQNTRAQYVDIIQNSSDNLLKLINDIIELSKIETSDFIKTIKKLPENIKMFIKLVQLFLIPAIETKYIWTEKF
jgi:signal transduction histidine kinase